MSKLFETENTHEPAPGDVPGELDVGVVCSGADYPRFGAAHRICARRGLNEPTVLDHWRGL